MKRDKEYILGFDVLKVLALIAIAFLHTNEFVFYTDVNPLGEKAPIFNSVFFYARLMTLSGQILVSVVYLLFGLSAKSKSALLKISGFALIGQGVLGLIFQQLEWDIYSYIGVSNLLILGVPFFYKRNIFTLVASIFFLFIPISFFQNWFPDSGSWAIVTGKMTATNSGSWPMLPWFFLSLLFYQVGLQVRHYRDFFLHWAKNEKALWVLFLFLSVPFYGFYYWVPIGPHFYQFIFTQSPQIFWGNFIIYIFLMRIALLKSTQEMLSGNRFVTFLTRTLWVRRLGIVYLISLIYLGVGMELQTQFMNHPWMFDLFFIGIIPVSELLARMLFYLNKFKTVIIKKAP